MASNHVDVPDKTYNSKIHSVERRGGGTAMITITATIHVNRLDANTQTDARDLREGLTRQMNNLAGEVYDAIDQAYDSGDIMGSPGD